MIRGFVLWGIVAFAAFLGLMYGTPEVRGGILILACFLALGSAGYAMDRIKKDGRDNARDKRS